MNTYICIEIVYKREMDEHINKQKEREGKGGKEKERG